MLPALSVELGGEGAIMVTGGSTDSEVSEVRSMCKKLYMAMLQYRIPTIKIEYLVTEAVCVCVCVCVCGWVGGGGESCRLASLP